MTCGSCQTTEGKAGKAEGSSPARLALACFLLFVAASPRAWSGENSAAVNFRKDVQPILAQYCYDCHGVGMNKGKVAFDEFKSDEELLGKHDLWSAVLKNVRAGLMPPEKNRGLPGRSPAPGKLVKYEAFGLDASDRTRAASRFAGLTGSSIATRSAI
jgi:hypothetical protein